MWSVVRDLRTRSAMGQFFRPALCARDGKWGGAAAPALPGFQSRTIILLFIAAVLTRFACAEKLTVMFSAEALTGQEVPIVFLIKLRPILGGCWDGEGRYSGWIESSGASDCAERDSLKQVEAMRRIGLRRLDEGDASNSAGFVKFGSNMK